MTTIRIDESKVIQQGAVTVTVKAEALTVNSDAEAIGADVSRAIAAAIGEAIRGIQAMSRDGKHRMFNRTGELARSIEAVLGAGGYDIVAPPGYLQDDALFEKLLELVPAIEDPFTLAGVAQALEKATADMITVGR